MNTTPKPASAGNGEPEELGQSDVAHLMPDKPKAKDKPAKFLDPVADYLKAGPMSPVRILAQCYSQEGATQGQIDSLLREVERDDRFLKMCDGGEVLVVLADQAPAPIDCSAPIDRAKTAEPEAPAAPAPAATVEDSPAPSGEIAQPAGEPDVKSVGEHMAEAQAAAPAPATTPTLISQPISPVATRNSEAGTRVKHDVFGEGRIIANGTEVVRVQFDTNGEKEFLWSFIAGRLPLVPMATIARPMTPDEAAAQHLANLEAHHARGKELSLRYFELKADQAEKQADLNEVHKELKKHSELMAEHMRAEPRADGQTTIPFNDTTTAAEDLGAGEGGEVETKPAEVWPYAVAPDQVIDGDAHGLDLHRLLALLRHDLPPADKPHQLGTSGTVEVKASRYVVRDHSEKHDRWFLQPLFTKDEWQQLHEATFGRAVEDFDQNDEAKTTRTVGGADCGRVVKVGAKKFVIGPESQGLVVTIDAKPLPEVDLKAKEPTAETAPAGDPAPAEAAATA